LQALDGVNLRAERGESVALLGPNGAGKTTLIRILCTLMRPDSGRASISGHDVMRDPTGARESIGVVFQDPSLDTRLTVAENLEFHGYVYGMPRRDRAARAVEMLELVELEEWRDTPVRELSGGMKRRLEIARALMHRPRLLLLDEPTAGLDAQTRAGIWGYLDRLHKEEELTLLVTTHYTEEVEPLDRVCIMERGRIIAAGRPFELKARHGEIVLRLAPRDAETEARIRAAWPDARQAGDRLLISVPDEAVVDHVLAEFGSKLRSVDIEAATLSSVFLSLTGRDISDAATDRHAAASVQL
jgi:ABC-2 type transport system ATP-binding protein